MGKLAIVFTVALILMFSSLSISYAQTVTPSVTGGSLAKQGEHPWVVSIRSLSTSCTGIIINQEWVLTAAHCVSNDVPAEWFKIEAGGVNKGFNTSESGEIKVSAVRKFVHPEFDRSVGDNELALLKIGKLPVTEYISPIGIYTDTMQDIKGPVVISGTIAGWGRTEEGSTNLLHSADVEYICHRHTDSNLICRSPYTPDVGACAGDSGGIVEINTSEEKKLLFGVIWGGNACNEEIRSTNITSLTPSHIEWINSVINKPQELIYLPSLRAEGPNKLYFPLSAR